MADEDQKIGPANADLSSAEPINWLISALESAEQASTEGASSLVSGSPAHRFVTGRVSAFRAAITMARAAIAQATGEGR